MNSTGIDIECRPGGIRIHDRRHDVTRVLSALPAAQAIGLIPRLLPVCAEAQRIAAERALEAARGCRESPETGIARDRRLHREQAMAAAWRLLIDWPRILGHAGDSRRLARLGRLDDRELARCLPQLLPGLEDARDRDGLDGWVARSPCTAAQVLRLAAREHGRPFAVALLRGKSLWQAVRQRIEGEAPRVDGEAAICVGALAMARHPMVSQLQEAPRQSPRMRLLLAMLLDTLAIADALRDGPRDSGVVQELRGDSGVGIAVTARGPVFHELRLGRDERVERWTLLAPTDWHVASGGLLENLLRATDESRDPAVDVNAVDPCAPWRLQRQEATAHA